MLGSITPESNLQGRLTAKRSGKRPLVWRNPVPDLAVKETPTLKAPLWPHWKLVNKAWLNLEEPIGPKKKADVLVNLVLGCPLFILFGIGLYLYPRVDLYPKKLSLLCLLLHSSCFLGVSSYCDQLKYENSIFLPYSSVKL